MWSSKVEILTPVYRLQLNHVYFDHFIRSPYVTVCLRSMTYRWEIETMIF